MTNTALITGSYGGFGRCFAEIHTRKGGDLTLIGRDKDMPDEARRLQVVQHVRDACMRSADIAFLLGYYEHSSSLERSPHERRERDGVQEGCR